MYNTPALPSVRLSQYFYNVSGEEAERLLRLYGSEADFLARPSGSGSGYSISILRCGGSITHLKLRQEGGQVDLCGGERFASLHELVLHHMSHPGAINSKDGDSIHLRRPLFVPLCEPAAAEARAPLAERWFHANVSGMDAVRILAAHKHWTYLVRESRQPGRYAISVKTDEDKIKHIAIERNEASSMYCVCEGEEFRSVSELLAHYKNNPMVEQHTHHVVHLQHMHPSTEVPADAIDARVSLLQLTDPLTNKTGYQDEFERIQKADKSLFSRKDGKRDENKDKNRYRNIVPYDHTRVVLKEVGNNETDYINANYINIERGAPLYLLCPRSYISTQGCLPHTVLDFWRMVWQEGSRVIVMTTNEKEREKVKCHRYWPCNGEPPLRIGPFCVEKTEEAVHDSYITRTLVLSREGEPPRSLAHLQFTGWPDHDCPEHPDAVLKFLEAADDAADMAPEDQGPVVVHCSAGIGRTGTCIVIDILLNQIKLGGPSVSVDVPGTVLMVRQQRSDMVQTDAQYMFLYKALSCYMQSRLRPAMRGNRSNSRHSSSSSCSVHNQSFGSAPLAPPPLPSRQRAYVNNGETAAAGAAAR